MNHLWAFLSAFNLQWFLKTWAHIGIPNSILILLGPCKKKKKKYIYIYIYTNTWAHMGIQSSILLILLGLSIDTHVKELKTKLNQR